MAEASGRWRVFLSSTFQEMSEYRLEIRRQCAQALAGQVDLVALDDGTYSRFTPDATVLSVEKLRACDLDILLVGRELGSRAGTGESFTEQEIAAAHKNGIPIYAFMFGAEAAGPGGSVQGSPEPGSARDWELRRELKVRTLVRPRKIFELGPIREPASVAAEVVKMLRRDWLENHARPHSLRATRPNVTLVDREEPYRELKRRALAGLTSVVSGFYGTGKSTLVEALCSDQDAARMHTLPMLELSVDLSMPSSVGNFRQRVGRELEAARKRPAAQRRLVVVTMSSVLDRGMLAESARHVEQVHPGGLRPHQRAHPALHAGLRGA